MIEIRSDTLNPDRLMGYIGIKNPRVRQWERRILPHGWSLSMVGDGAVYGRESSGFAFRRHPFGPPRDSFAADGEAFSEAWDALMVELVKALRLRELVEWINDALQRISSKEDR